ncbi:sugar MFS transporter [Cytophaga hutchinsonii]|uniref:sugar MFS transporter n=1 Tax=Cytophaga hutchinsonii TaxID=985 RepID=UPI0009249416|nr:sugar MFS transporter [Cytophaga hutchinsonii]SFX12585.1 MFS transporter, FHS family, L-fucose permease [Cytophaga hutchinsonii ATCC 33406]
MAAIGAPVENRTSTNHDNKNYTFPLIVITTLFFMWGFITCLNDILIPKFKGHFDLLGWQAMLVQSAFFSAFFLVSLLYFIVSALGFDLISKIGYKNAIIVGLGVSGIGCLLFIPAADNESFNSFLGALFVLASGITILQMGANPYVALLGAPQGSSARLNMTQAFNSLGTTVAPVIGGMLIFKASSSAVEKSLESVKHPYIGLAVALFVLAAIIAVVPLPKLSGNDGEAEQKGIGAYKYLHLLLGVGCIFFYVGGEVSIGSAIINYLELEKIAGLTPEKADKYLSFYWGGAMIGRFFGAIFLNETTDIKKHGVMLAGIMLLSYILGTFLMNKDILLHGENMPMDFTTPIYFTGITLLNLAAFYYGKNKPGFTLGLFAGIVCFLLAVTMFASGSIAMWAVLSIGLFNSIMSPTIFTLAIKDLGVDTGQGASLLVMAIVGGAIIPPLQGLLYGEANSGLQTSFIVPLICYVYIMYYGFVGSKPKRLS